MNRLGASAINEVCTLRVHDISKYPENKLKLHETLDECNLKEFSNITNSEALESRLAHI